MSRTRFLLSVQWFSVLTQFKGIFVTSTGFFALFSLGFVKRQDSILAKVDAGTACESGHLWQADFSAPRKEKTANEI